MPLRGEGTAPPPSLLPYSRRASWRTQPPLAKPGLRLSAHRGFPVAGTAVGPGSAHLAPFPIPMPPDSLPSPCSRLSRAPWSDITPTSTMQAPSPYRSRGVGDPTFRHQPTFERDVGEQHMAFNQVIPDRPSGRAYREQNRTRGSGWRWRSDVLPASVRLHSWPFGFRQSRFSPIAQALPGHRLHVFGSARLSQHATFPSPFQVQVGWVASQSLP